MLPEGQPDLHLGTGPATGGACAQGARSAGAVAEPGSSSLGNQVAETEGFEPSVPDLPVRRFSKPLVSQPLTHVSAWSAALTAVWPRRVAIAMHFAPRNAKDCAFLTS